MKHFFSCLIVLIARQSDEHVEDESTIYHLHTSTPHIHDISLSDPYGSIDAIAQQMIHNFGAHCRQGQDMVRENLDAHTLAHMEHITSPMDNDQNRVRTCRIIKEANAEIKARLPCATFVVSSTEVDTELARSLAAFAAASDALPVVGADVHGTFIDRTPAVERARVVAQEMAGRVPNGRVVERGTMGLYEVAFAVHGYEDCLPIVIARSDSGQTA